MSISQDEILSQVEMIWGSLLGLCPVPSDHLEVPAGNEGFVTGCIQITGAWEGAVTVVCDERLARQIASILFNLDSGDLTTELIHDAVGELTNIIGGNLKALLPSPCYLCLPAVVEGNEYLLRVLKATPICEVSFLSGDFPFLVCVFERSLPASRGGTAAVGTDELQSSK